jgi:hypothetical protein
MQSILFESALCWLIYLFISIDYWLFFKNS